MLADAAAEGIVVAKDGDIINVNQRVSELSERSSEELLGKRVFGDLLVAYRRPYCAVSDRRIETLMITASGGAVPVEVIWKPYKSGLRANEVYAIRDCKSAVEPKRRSGISRTMIPSLGSQIAQP
jgi:PAS domain-containing protein